MPWKSVEITVQSIASKLEAQILGEGSERVIRRLSSLEDATLDSLAFTKRLGKRIPKCGALLCDAEIAEKLSSSIPCIVVKDPVRALVDVASLFYEPDPYPPGIHKTACIDPSAKLDPSVFIGAYCCVGPDVTIGNSCQIHPHVVIYPRVRIGNNVTVHANVVLREDCILHDGVTIQPGAVLGADGFGYIPDPQRGLIPVPQMGAVELQPFVEVGANSCIDRATLGTTAIGTGTKIDNLVQIGHNAEIGSHSIICGLVGIAGSCSIGNQVVLGGQAGVADHITIVDKTRFAAKSGVVSDIRQPGDYGGFPAAPAREWRKGLVAVRLLASQLQKSPPKIKHEE